MAHSRGRVGDIIASARSIYVSGSAAEILEARALLRAHRPVDATVTGVFFANVNRNSWADPEIGLKARSFFLNREIKQHLAQGHVDYCPWRYSIIDRWMREPGRFDTAMVMLSPPDARGNHSLGIQVDFVPGLLGKVERIVGFINPQMPRTSGDSVIPASALAATVDYDRPLLTMVDKSGDDAVTRIAERIVSLISDGATVQFGIGQIPSAVLARLQSHRDLRIHTGIVDDGILALDASGALDRHHPIITGTAVGTERLYAALDRNDRFRFRAVSYTHGYRVLSAIERLVAVNSVLQVDLLGQTSAEASGGQLVASPGGLPDFARAANDAPGGQSIIAVRAAGLKGRTGGIVPLLEMPHAAATSSSDADIVVTEFGVARLRGLSFDQRAEALIGIAAPADQALLGEQWGAIRWHVLPV